VYWEKPEEESAARNAVGVLRARIIGIINGGLRNFNVTVTARPLRPGFDPSSESYVETLERTVFVTPHCSCRTVWRPGGLIRVTDKNCPQHGAKNG
jgi:hypothetical protein